MDERLQKALEFANYRQTLNTRLHKIKIRSEGLLMFAKNGGNFVINHELICFLDYLARSGLADTVILDSNNIPIKITDTTEFLNEVTRRYFEVTNDYLNEYQLIRTKRNVTSIIDIKESE